MCILSLPLRCGSRHYRTSETTGEGEENEEDGPSRTPAPLEVDVGPFFLAPREPSVLSIPKRRRGPRQVLRFTRRSSKTCGTLVGTIP